MSKSGIITITVLLLAISPCLAADLYIGNSGNDANDGLTSAAAKQTISAVNSWTFSAGDTLYVNCSSVYSAIKDGILDLDNGNSASKVKVRSYGTCTTPNIYTGEYQASFTTMNISNSTSDWQDVDGPTWRYRINHTSGSGDVAQLWFNITLINYSDRDSVKANFGIKRRCAAVLSNVGDFTVNWTTSTSPCSASQTPSSTLPRYLYVYSEVNPATKWPGGIGIVYNEEAMYIDGPESYQDYGNISLTHWGKEGFNLDGGSSNVHNITVCNNRILYGGGGHCFGGCVSNQHWGNGGTLWYRNFDINWCNNYHRDIIDAAVSPQIIGDPGSTVRAERLVFQNNTMINVGYCFEISYDNETTSVKDIVFSQNTCIDMDAGLFAWTRVNESDQTAIIRCYRLGDTYNQLNVRLFNNLCLGSPGFIIGTNSNTKGLGDARNITFHDNIYHKPFDGSGRNGSSTWFNIVGDSAYTSLSSYQLATIQEDNTTNGSVTFYNESAGDYRPLTGQDACSGYAGLQVGAFACVSLPASPTNHVILMALYD